MIEMLTDHWSPILAIFAAGIVSWNWYVIRARKRKKIWEEKLQRKQAVKEIRKQRLLAAEKNRKSSLLKGAEEALALARDQILNSGPIIDSSVWMNKAYEDFFFLLGESCSRRGQPFTLFSQQFEELCELRRTVEDNSASALSARTAIQRIDAFQKADLLHIIPAARVACTSAADEPLIIRLVFAAASKKRPVCLVTDDIELRIRVRQIMRDRNQNGIQIPDITDILLNATTFAKAVKEGLMEAASQCWQESSSRLKIVPFTAYRNTA